MDAAPTSIDDLLSRATAAGASDLHLVAGAPPSVRVRGDLAPMNLYLATSTFGSAVRTQAATSIPATTRPS